MSTQALNDQTLYKVMHNAKPNLTDLPDWGARVFMMKTNAGKLDNKSTEGHWLGYVTNTGEVVHTYTAVDIQKHANPSYRVTDILADE